MNYVDTLRRVLVRAKGCPESEAADAMRDAVSEFCRETYCFTTGAQVVSSALPTTVESIDLAQFVVIDIVDAQIDGEPIDVVAMNAGELEDATDADPVLVFVEESQLILVPAPASPVTIDLLVVVMPGPESTDFPDFIWQKHYRALIDGAIANLLTQADRPWSSDKGAVRHESNFREAITLAATKYSQNRVHRARRLRVRPAESCRSGR